MKSRDIVLVAVLLAAGTVLQYCLSWLNTPIIPDVITAFYCLSIILFRPKVYEALGIGIIGGALSMLIPGSILPPANLVSGIAGACCCFYCYELVRDKSNLAPLVSTTSATLVSGVTFVVIVTVVMFGTIRATYSTFAGFVLAFLPLIVITALLNAVIIQALTIVLGKVRAQI